jgi:alkanesulfonate monooxygenase SsuD/methylene tetrahydromethanopterin reductase-like flavin-dependent oxidoreductase (luciferase family)
MMKYGIAFPNGGVYNPQTLAEFAALAEAHGWDGVFLEDYIVWQSHQDVPTYDPWIALAAMAMRTTTIRLGTSITPLPRRRPWKVARETVTLDHLSNGRLILGVGLGDAATDISFTRFGEATDVPQRAKMLDESLDILIGAWRGAAFTHHGLYYHVDEVTLLPKPIQSPRIPIWVGGAYPNPGPMKRAACYDGACLYKAAGGDFTPDEVRALKAFVDARRPAPAPYDIALGGRHRAEDWEQDRALITSLAEAGMTWWVEYVPPQIGGLNEMLACITRGPLRID